MNLKEQRAAALAKAQKAAAKAKAEGRPMTAAEASEFDAAIAEVEQLDGKLTAAEGSKARFDQLAALAPGDSGEDFTPAGLFTDAEAAGFKTAFANKTSFATTVDGPRVKAAIGTSVLPTAGSLTSPNPPGNAAVALRNLFVQAPAESGMVRYYRIGAATAGTVAEGGLKPDSGASVTPVDASLIKVANLTQLTDELLEDAPGGVITAIQAEAVAGVIRKENAEIVAAITGASGVQTATGTLATGIDVLAGAVGTAEATNGITPAAMLINPANLATLRTQKASTGGAYFIDPFSGQPQRMHNVPLVPTPAVPAGTVFLLSPGFGVFYMRGGLRVELGLQAGDFERNTRTLRVEERVLPAVVRPVLIHKVTLT